MNQPGVYRAGTQGRLVGNQVPVEKCTHSGSFVSIRIFPVANIIAREREIVEKSPAYSRGREVQRELRARNRLKYSPIARKHLTVCLTVRIFLI